MLEPPKDLKVEVRLRSPESFTDDELRLELGVLDWTELVVIPDPSKCSHVETCCPDCSDMWQVDYFMRIKVDGVQVFISPDYPEEGK